MSKFGAVTCVLSSMLGVKQIFIAESINQKQLIDV